MIHALSVWAPLHGLCTALHVVVRRHGRLYAHRSKVNVGNPQRARERPE